MEYLFHFKASLLFFQTAVIAVALATTTGPWLWAKCDSDFCLVGLLGHAGLLDAVDPK